MKRIISTVLTLALITGLFSVTAFADDSSNEYADKYGSTAPEDVIQQTDEAPETDIQSEHVTYALTDTGEDITELIVGKEIEVAGTVAA